MISNKIILFNFYMFNLIDKKTENLLIKCMNFNKIYPVKMTI